MARAPARRLADLLPGGAPRLAGEGLTYTTVQDAVAERRACGAANDRFLKPVKELCKQCQVVYARCERKLDGLEAALADGDPVPHYQVFAPGPAHRHRRPGAGGEGELRLHRARHGEARRALGRLRLPEDVLK